jgi:signal transduction histidine kinase
MQWSRLNHTRLLRYAGLLAYLTVGTPLVMIGWADARLSELHRPNSALLWWALSYVLFGLIYWVLTRNLGSRRYLSLKLLGLALMTAAAVAVGWFSHSGLSAILMVVVSVVLPWLLPIWLGVAWMLLQTVCLVVVFSTFPELDHSIGLAILQSTLYLSMSVLAFVTSVVGSELSEERERQRQLNAELRATRALLAESSRIAERMRIARELHDLVGHHLTALSLNLEVASHLAEGAAAEHVRKGQATAKQLLADVREVVSELRQDDALDLTQALQGLIEGVPALHVHLELPPRFAIEDPRRAQVVLRCAQELITNAVRHAGARNLWLTFRDEGRGELELEARDDGRGAADLQPGNGLSGMRERLAEYGGRMQIDTALNRGFCLNAWLPLTAPGAAGPQGVATRIGAAPRAPVE